MGGLTLFGLFAGTVMMVSYWLEDKSRFMILIFSVACFFSSIYLFLVGAWPFMLVEGIWSVVAFRRFLHTR